MAVSETARLITALELQDKFSKPIDAAGRSLGKFEDRAKSLDQLGFHIGRGLGNAAHNISLIGIAAGGLVVTGLVASVHAASDLNESINKVDVVFGQMAGKVHAFGQTSATALGLSRQQAEESASSFGNLFKVVGLTDDASSDMSIKLVTLAGDLASFNNIDPAEALEKLRSGLIGEAEPLRSVGVLLTEASVQEEAYASGIAERGKKLTESQKVQARYNLILKQTTTAQGDFARTSTGLANQQRILKASLTDTAAVIGTALLPTVNKLILKFTTLLKDNQPAIQQFADSLPGVADRIEKVLGGLPWDTIGSAFQLMGSGAKAALEAFESAPPWLQTAILTGWGLNKLTGGALGSIAVDIGKLAFGGLLARGASPANPVWVQSVGGIGGPGGPGDVLGKGLTLAGILKFIGFRAIPALVVGELAGQSNISGRVETELLRQTLIRNGGDVKAALQQTGTTLGTINDLLAHPELQTGLSSEVLTALDAIDGKLGDLVTATTPTGGATGVSDLGSASHHRGTLGVSLAAAVGAVDPAIDRLLKERQLTDTALAPLGTIDTNVAQLPHILDRSQRSAQALAASSEAFRREAGGSLSTIASKNFSPTVKVDVTTNVSVSNLERTLISHRIAGSTTVGGFTESAF